MANYASAELKLIKQQASQSGSVKSKPVFILDTAVKTANAALIGKQCGSVILAYSRSPTAQDSVVHAAPTLMAATLTGKYIGNILPSTPRLLETQKAPVAPGKSPLSRTFLEISPGLITANRVYRILLSTPGFLEIQKAPVYPGTAQQARTLLQISTGLITSHGVYSDIGYGEELHLLKQAVSQTSLPQGQAEYKLSKGTIAHSLVSSNVFTGEEQLLIPSRRTSSAIIHSIPELLSAIDSGQMPLVGESKLDEKLTISTVGLWSFDEKIILTISGAKQFSEMGIIRSPRSLSLVQTNQQLALLKGTLQFEFIPQNLRIGEEQFLNKSQRNQSSTLANQQLALLTGTVQLGFIPLNQRNGEEQLLAKSLRNQSTVQTQPQLGLLTAQVSRQFMGFQRPEKFEQLFLGTSPRITSKDIAYTSPGLQRATITGLVVGKDLNAVPKEFPLLRSRAKDSSIVSPMILPILLQKALLSGAIFGGSQRGSRELLYNAGKWIGSFRLDARVQLIPCKSLDERLVILARASFDEAITITATPTIMGLDERLFLWKNPDQPSLIWLTSESWGIDFTKGEILIEHPALTKIEFYDKSDALLDVISDLTDLTAGKIVTRASRAFDIQEILTYLKVTTADGRVHIVFI